MQRPLQNPEVVKEIHTISSRIAGGGESNSAKEAYVRSMQGEEVYFLHKPMKPAKIKSVMLSFTEEDARGVVILHDDALVVTMTVANHAIHRILVDNESSANSESYTLSVRIQNSNALTAKSYLDLLRSRDG